jgi:hypothetical protein
MSKASRTLSLFGGIVCGLANSQTSMARPGPLPDTANISVPMLDLVAVSRVVSCRSKDALDMGNSDDFTNSPCGVHSRRRAATL